MPDAEVVAVSSGIASPANPVFYYRDATDSHRLVAYDWSGKRRGEIEVAASEPYGLYPSADGTMILLSHAHVLSGGRSVGLLSTGTWAGDDDHICAFLNELGGRGSPRSKQISANDSEGIDTPGWLFEQSVSGQSKRVAAYGSFGPHGGPVVLACNAQLGRAVIAQSFVAQQSGIEVLDLSSGQVLYRYTQTQAAQPAGVVVSEDGSLLAEGSTASTLKGNDSFVVHRLPGGSVIAQISGGGAVAFSSDNTRVLTVQYLNGSNQAGRYRVVDLATSRIVWSATLSPGTYLTRPGTGDFLIASRTYEPSATRPNGTDAFEDVWLVPADGSALMLLKHAVPIE
jgi:hypothetical protein